MTVQPAPVAGARLGAMGGVLALVACIAVALLFLGVTSTDPPGFSLGVASAFFGLWAFDLLLAAGFAVGRRQGRTRGKYSPLVGFSAALLPIWVIAAGSAAGSPGWLASPVAVGAVAIAAMIAQVAAVRHLGRVGRIGEAH